MNKSDIEARLRELYAEKQEEIEKLENELDELDEYFEDLHTLHFNMLWGDTITALTDVEAGKLLKAIYAMADGEENPLVTDTDKPLAFVADAFFDEASYHWGQIEKEILNEGA